MIGHISHAGQRPRLEVQEEMLYCVQHKHHRSQFSMMNPLHDHQCCLLLFFLFVQVHFLAGTNVDFRVLQSPPNLTLSKGETAEMKCSWNGPKNISRKGSWYKDKTIEKISSISKRTIILSQNNSSTLVIHNVSSNDSGLYVCKVIQDIPKLITNFGKGTQLTVNSQTKTSTENQEGVENPENDKNGLPLQLTVSLAVVVGLLVFSAPFIICRLKRAGNNVIREAPIESEEHREEVESSSNSSRGSTQWCQVPVYEAYFDHRRDGEDG
ncbi:uncharacterized protein LOC121690156 [Alosa sapidissima]|uniref:uncharacterized protein LOC121690156 n=1 Tax=Alosa sapidissima TaxID=34773 RepID=UPI001C0A10E6|nr:uncharacterized protein LOC121690156 [Alosa sapidissima]